MRGEIERECRRRDGDLGQRNALSWSWNDNGANVAEDTERFRPYIGTYNTVGVDIAQSRERSADPVWVWVWAEVRELEKAMGLDMAKLYEKVVQALRCTRGSLSEC